MTFVLCLSLEALRVFLFVYSVQKRRSFREVVFHFCDRRQDHPLKCVSSCFFMLGKSSLFLWKPPLLFSLSQELLFFGCWVFFSGKNRGHWVYTAHWDPTLEKIHENPNARFYVYLKLFLICWRRGKPFTKRSSKTEWEGGDGNRGWSQPHSPPLTPSFHPDKLTPARRKRNRPTPHGPASLPSALGDLLRATSVSGSLSPHQWKEMWKIIPV